MSDVHDDLATLISPVSFTTQKMEAAKRVEAEIARLEQENGALRAETALKRTINRNAIEKWTAAEAQAARLRDGLRAYRSALRSGEPESPQLAEIARALLAEDGAALEQSGTCGPGCWPGHDCDITSLAEDGAA